jgi:hypothetical protein
MSDPLAYLTEQLEGWRRAGTYQRLRVLQSETAAESCFDGKEVVNLASNNYLGLATHPRLREAALEATRRFGVGSGAVRSISGTMSLHMELERRIAEFKKVEAAVVFQSGFAARLNEDWLRSLCAERGFAPSFNRVQDVAVRQSTALAGNVRNRGALHRVNHLPRPRWPESWSRCCYHDFLLQICWR